MARSTDVTLIKLGGSLITDKARPRAARRAVIRRLASEIAAGRGRKRLIVGHGSGSFGHVEAAATGLGSGPVPAARRDGIARTQAAAHALHRLVLDALRAEDLPVFSLPTSAWMRLDAGRPRRVFTEPLERALALGMIPVVCGDVVMDAAWGAGICSTETALVAIARRLSKVGPTPRRAFWLGNTNGVYNAGAQTLPTLDAADWRKLERDVGGSAATDVTGGMRHRVETALALARLGTTSWILDGRAPGVLSRALKGGAALGGTRVAAVVKS